MKNKKLKRALIITLFLNFSFICWCTNIVFPWRATTAIVKSGDCFEVWLNADAGQKVTSVTLKGPYNTVSTKTKVVTGNWVYDATSQNTYNTKIMVKVSRSAPADRYDIIVNTSAGNVISPAGVKVIKQYKSDYYILHFSDIHAFQNKYPTTMQRISTIVDIANIINPEMVFNTGDNLYRPNDERMNALFAGDTTNSTKGLNTLNAAVFTVPGNHDIDFDNMPEKGFYKEKAAWWNKWWGLQSFYFTYGKGRFMGVNNGWHEFDTAPQFSAIGSWLNNVGMGNFRLGAAHIRDHEMPEFDSVAKLNLVLLGHNHHIANQNPSALNGKPIQYIVNSVRDNMEFNLYRVNGKTGKYTPVSGNTAQVSYIENPEDSKSPELYKPKLNLSYLKANDGSNTSNTAIFVNKFDFAIEGAKVRFVLPLGTKYSISNGKIEQAFNGNTVHVVDVIVDLAPNTQTVVNIK